MSKRNKKKNHLESALNITGSVVLNNKIVQKHPLPLSRQTSVPSYIQDVYSEKISKEKTTLTFKEKAKNNTGNKVYPSKTYLNNALDITYSIVNDKVIQDKPQVSKTVQKESLKNDKQFVLTSFNSSSVQHSQSKVKAQKKLMKKQISLPIIGNNEKSKAKQKTISVSDTYKKGKPSQKSEKWVNKVLPENTSSHSPTVSRYSSSEKISENEDMTEGKVSAVNLTDKNGNDPENVDSEQSEDKLLDISEDSKDAIEPEKMISDAITNQISKDVQNNEITAVKSNNNVQKDKSADRQSDPDELNQKVPSKTNNNANEIETAQGESFQKNFDAEEPSVWSSTDEGLCFFIILNR